MEDTKSRIKLELKSEDPKPLSGWQLQEFMYNINRGYNKIDLINQISKLLNEGVNPENIIIINKSYEINNSYSYLQKSNEIDLNNEKLVEKFYNLGKPITMFPNPKIKKVEIIFSLYESLYTMFRANKINPIPKKNLKKYIDLPFEESINELKSDAISILNKLKISEKKIIENIIKNIEKNINKSINNYYDFNKDEINRKNFKLIADKKIIELNEEQKQLYINMDKKYYNRFFKYLKKIDRPIILKYDELKNKLIVIRKEYMINDVENENFLDYKEYTHNSPFAITMIAGVTISCIIALLYKGVKQEQFNTEQMYINEVLEKKIDGEIDEMIELSQSKQLNYVNDIKSPFVKNKLFDVNNKLKKSLEKTLKGKGITKVINIEKIEEKN